MNRLLVVVVAAWHAVAGAQTPPPPAAQNPSPMVEATRAHERLSQKPLPGTTRSFVGPSGKAVDVFVPDRARGRDVFNLVVHFLGIAWLPEQAVAELGDPTVAAVVNIGAGSARTIERLLIQPSSIRCSGA